MAVPTTTENDLEKKVGEGDATIERGGRKEKGREEMEREWIEWEEVKVGCTVIA